MGNNIKFYFIVFILFLKGKSITSIRKIIEDYKHKIIMLEFRSSALLFGFDINNYTDEEILEMISNAGKQIADCSLTFQEASEAFNNISKSMAGFQPELN